MADYCSSIEIPASSEQAFAFASDVSNFPRFVPTTRRAKATGGHVHVEGVSHGAGYADDGQLYVDTEHKLMRWGSGESGYRGELSISDAGGGGSRIEIKLHFSERLGHVPPSQEVSSGLEECLARLRQELATA